MADAEIGVLGLGVMGRNLALNIADRGIRVSGYERDPDLRKVAQREAALSSANEDLAGFVASLRAPRAVLLMITAGPAVDQAIETLLPLLSPGDVIADGGNSDYQDTARREARVREAGIGYLGLGVSGGEEGARHGPALMAGGSAETYQRLETILLAIAAKADDGAACAERLGNAAAVGHFVKMMHNGIEYADMQLIAEIYDLLARGQGLGAAAIAEIFDAWRDGPLSSFLIDVTATVLRKADPETGRPLVDLVLDSAGQKGTGRWASIAALELGVAAPSIAEAVSARVVSSLTGERSAAAARFSRPDASANSVTKEQLADALLAGKICAYAQGFAVLAAASEANGWELALDRVARNWRAGCIIRAGFLDDVAAAFSDNPEIANLLMAPAFSEMMERTVPALRAVVTAAVGAGIPVPALSASLAYFDGYVSARLPANLIQAQRDFFGAHQFKRVDRAGDFHEDWSTTS
ncbi:MAG: NADP-dependent phosphogluconate dehydrogenase [Alphaproteobacteria bacterium]|jgi:6-phosphogluconate dehydrogenase|nr:NADP-dependent phosphogluconate dehydrogenase [Alphaproteobacteria bacterium]